MPVRGDYLMLTTQQAIAAIIDNLRPFGSEQVSLEDAPRRILRQQAVAERDQPPFDRVMMDGIAVDFSAFAEGCRRFSIQSTQAAGDPVTTLGDRESCIEIMTGAVLPVGADCVIPVERISVTGGIAEIETDYEARRLQFIHERGSDHKRGDIVLEPGHRIRPMEVAILASCGMNAIEVSVQPTVRVISTGNELVEAGRPIADHQVRLSNGPALCSMLGEHGFTDCRHKHLPDDIATLEENLARQLDEADTLVLSGGVSMGKADFVPEVLAGLGVRKVFHKISQRPGKPMWFGFGPAGQTVFALPGNPVSALVCCRHYVIPALLAASGKIPPTVQRRIVLAEDVTFSPNLTCFLPVRVESGVPCGLQAVPVPTNTSGDFTSLKGTDGYVELAMEQEFFAKGTSVPFIPW
jgi:molybdopterin molybdotransferase